MQKQGTATLGDYIIFLFLGFIWGSSFILMKFTLFGMNGEPLFSAYQLAGLRIFIAGFLLYPASIPKLKKIKGWDWLFLFMVGVFGNFIPAFLFASAIESNLASGIAGILNSLTPIFALILGMVVFKSSFSKRQGFGLGLGLIGAIGLISLKSGSGEILLGPMLLVVVATLCYAISLNIIKYKLDHLSSVTIASLGLGLVSIPSGIYLLFSGVEEVFVQSDQAWFGLGSAFVLAAIGTALALVFFNRLVARTTVIFASSVTYIIPLFAAMWGYVFKESLTIYHGLFGLIIVFGVYLVNRKPKVSVK